MLAQSGRRAEMAPDGGVEVREATDDQAHDILDKAAQHYLNMSGDQFVQQWNRGSLTLSADRPEVARVAILLPFGR
jgi:hypothetical protein